MLFTIFGVQLLTNNFMEIFSPMVSARITEYLAHNDAAERFQRAVAREQEEWDNADHIVIGHLGAARSSEVLKQAAMANAEDVNYSIFNDYNELTIQFGYVTLFATNFPLMSLLAWLNNVTEIRTDAIKYVHTFRRPCPLPARGIGSWETVLNILVFLAITTNCANGIIIGDLLGLGPNWNLKIAYFFVAEHLIYATKVSISYICH